MLKNNNKSSDSSRKKVWIDLDNTPHVLFFRPIFKEFNKRGYEVILTARDAFQVKELLDKFQLKATVIGHHHGKNKILKTLGLFYRALQIAPLILKEKPTLALSHGSRSQLILSKILKIPSILILDYEHIKMLPFINPDWVMTPELISIQNKFVDQNHIIKYPGIKEDVYVPEFEPNGDIRKQLNLKGQDLLITVRPPATEAHYHNPQSEQLFEAVVKYLGNHPNTSMVMLPRNKKQSDFIRAKWPALCSQKKIVIPEKAVDGLNLIWHSDLVVSGGGTMNREAAALGVPVYSIFRGKLGAVDQFLAKNDRLILLENPKDFSKKLHLIRKSGKYLNGKIKTGSLKVIVSQIIDIHNQAINPSQLGNKSVSLNTISKEVK